MEIFHHITWMFGERVNGGGENGRFGIDEFALWETSLTPEEINAIYNRGSGLDVSADNRNYQSNQLKCIGILTKMEEIVFMISLVILCQVISMGHGTLDQS